MKNEPVKKILYLLITMIVYICIYLIGYAITALIRQLIMINPYVLLGIYLVLFVIDTLITIKIMSMHKILNWLNQF